MAKPIDPVALGLLALRTTLADPRRAQRFLDMTGIGTDELRARALDPALLEALIGFLEAHEPDLVAVAGEIGVEPAVLSNARRDLNDGGN